MPAHPSVIAAMREALKHAPDDVSLRLHLAQMLLEGGEAAEALDQFSQVLIRVPDHRTALAGAAEAAEAAEEPSRAAAFRRLANALSSAYDEDDDPPFLSLEDPFLAETEGDEAEEPIRADWPTCSLPSDGFPSLEEGPIGPLPALTVADEDQLTDRQAERPTVTLADVAGLDDVKRRLNTAFLGPIRNPELMRAYRKSARGGLLLYGPPGCGKTFIARAVAGELGARFINVGLADVLDMWFGESERKLQALFDTARRNAPCVLFFDEIDALGQKRSHLRHHAGRNVVNQLLSEMDSLGSSNEGLFILGATNHPWDVDTALRRPGRFDRVMLVLPPDAGAREAILAYHLRDRPVEPGLNLRELAERTAEFSGADLAHLCESVVEMALEDSLASGKPRPIRAADFRTALKEVRASTRPWFETAKNFALFANDGGIYDDLLTYLRANRIA